MMENEKTTQYAYDDASLNEFDPLEDLDFDEDIDEDSSTLSEGPFGMPNPDAEPSFKGKLESFADKGTVEERIDALFDQMPTLHKVLYGILKQCDKPIKPDELNHAIEKLKQHHHCVYSPSTFCSLLEQAGALEKVDENGRSLEEFEQEPVKVVMDEVAYWTVAPAPQIFWVLTDAGRTRLETYCPLESIQACYDAEPQYAEVFTTTLRLCAQEGGATVRSIGDAIEDEPVLQEPRRYAMYFIDKLEHAGALDWTGSWTATEHGKDYLDQLDETH